MDSGPNRCPQGATWRRDPLLRGSEAIWYIQRIKISFVTCSCLSNILREYHSGCKTDKTAILSWLYFLHLPPTNIFLALSSPTVAINEKNCFSQSKLGRWSVRGTQRTEIRLKTTIDLTTAHVHNCHVLTVISSADAVNQVRRQQQPSRRHCQNNNSKSYWSFCPGLLHVNPLSSAIISWSKGSRYSRTVVQIIFRFLERSQKDVSH